MAYYIDPNAADDNASGLTSSTPKKYWNTVMQILTRNMNQQVYVKAGTCIGVHAVGQPMPSLQFANVTIDIYGGETNAMIDLLNYIPAMSGGWTPEGGADGGGHVWSRQCGTATHIRRVFAAASNNGVLVTQRVGGEALGRVPDAVVDTIESIRAALNEEDCWYGATAGLNYKLYMWTPSLLQDPSMYFQGLSYVQDGDNTNGSIYGLNIWRNQNTRINNIDIRGSLGAAIMVRGNSTDAVPNANIQINNCNVTYALNGAHVMLSTLNTTYNVNMYDIGFYKCKMDTSTSSKEQEKSVLYSKLSGASDMFLFVGRINGVRAVDCTSINAFHVGISLGAYDANGAYPINTGFLRHTVKADDWTTYTRGVTTYNCESSCYISQSTFVNMNVCSQFAGSVQITGNKWTQMRQMSRKPSPSIYYTTDGWVSFGAYRYDRKNMNVGDDRYVDIYPSGLLFAHNSCDGCYGTPVEFNVFNTTLGVRPKQSIPNNAVIMENNSITDTKPGREGKPVITTYDEGGLTVGTQAINVNNFYKGEGVVPTARWQTVVKNASAVTGVTSVLAVDPKWDRDLRLSKDSPLIRAGKSAGRFADHSGRKFGFPATIGAHESTWPGTRQLR